MSANDTTFLAVQRFLAHESSLLDAGDWRRWLDLFAEDAVYWMPAEPKQTDHLNRVSLLCDDAVMRELRCRRWLERAEEAGALSLQTTPRSLRHVSNLRVEAEGAQLIARAALLVAEYAGGQVRPFHAQAEWRLQAAGDSFRIAAKRVELLNCDGPLGDILTYF
jgi:benzoate/toluate 1,2-dioxygenase beta subunit